MIDLLKKIFTNPAMMYVASRYATYVIQFFNALFVAVYLGPFYLGIWGFIQLVISYIAQLNLGISHSVNVIISIDKENDTYARKVIGNGITMLFGLSLLLVLFFVANWLFNIDIGSKYNFGKYVIPVCIIGIVTYFNNLFSNIFRVYGKVTAIAINQSLFPILMLFVIFFFRRDSLLWAMVFVNVLSVLIAFLLFIIQRPVSLKPVFNWEITKIIQKKGWHLFIYNSCFFLVMITTRSFISSYYKVEEFGFFTFSFSLAQTVLLFLEALAYLIFPKMLNRFANSDNAHTSRILEIVRKAYITLAHGAVYVMIVLFPFFLYFFPKYDTVFPVFALIALTVVLYTNAFGYGGVLMARGYEKLMGRIALLTLMLNIGLAYLFILVFQVTYEYVIIATMCSYLFFVVFIGLYGRKELSLHHKFMDVLNDVFPVRMLLPFVSCIILVLLQVNQYWLFLSLLLFVALNYKNLSYIIIVAKRIIQDRSFINI